MHLDEKTSMIARPHFMILTIFLCSLMSCEKFSDSDLDYPEDSFYFNSFESFSDTTGWHGIGTDNFIEDAPETGGKYSVRISGGCVIPHAYYWTGPLSEDCKLVLKCWAKNLSNGGLVGLGTDKQSAGIYISVSETSWTHYVCEDTLHCTAGSRVRIELISGGFLPSAMLVDQIELSVTKN
jgi:hypothetical protein